MKKAVNFLTIAGFMLFGALQSTFAKEAVAGEASKTFRQELKQRFIEGGPGFMGIVLIALILGLAIAIERIITLNLATTNTDKLIANVEDALSAGGVEAAKEVTRNTKGPVASIFTQGLMRMSEGIDMVEKSIIAYGSVEMGRLEKGLVWVSLFIALAPMLGFMGTVIGMILAFDKIAAAGDMNPSLVAGGIKVALLTTVFGLIVAIILQIFQPLIPGKPFQLKIQILSLHIINFLIPHSIFPCQDCVLLRMKTLVLFYLTLDYRLYFLLRG